MSLTPELVKSLVDTCDRLLNLVTGPRALTCPDRRDAVGEALGLLSDLEGHLKCYTGHLLPPLQEDALAELKHRAAVLEHISEVVESLCQAGYLLG